MPMRFDPLVDLDGLWTTEFADRYLPLPGLPDARYECIDGRSVMTPAEVGTHSYGEIKLARRLRHAAVELFTIGGFGGYDTVAKAASGQRLQPELPFPIDVDPADLLP